MAKIKAILERIKSKISSEELAKIESDISEGIAEDEKLYTQLADLRRESAERRERVQELEAMTTKLRARETELQSEVDKLKVSTDTPEYKAALEKAAKFDELVEKQNSEIKTKWAEKAKILAVDKTHKLFDKVQKVKDRFTLPKDEKDELSIDVIKRNLETFELLESTQYFDAVKIDTGGNPPAGAGSNAGNEPFSYGPHIKKN